jgi:diacylglycerol kinase (ATP)
MINEHPQDRTGAMPKRSKNPVRHVADATRYSLRGLQEAWRCELSFRIEIMALAICFPLAFWLGTTGAQRAVLVLSLLAIIIVELLNSAIESVVDRIGSEIHELSGRAKNMGSAAVLMVLIAAAAVWGIIAYERFVK